jgi:hypothetical protein
MTNSMVSHILKNMSVDYTVHKRWLKVNNWYIFCHYLQWMLDKLQRLCCVSELIKSFSTKVFPAHVIVTQNRLCSIKAIFGTYIWTSCKHLLMNYSLKKNLHSSFIRSVTQKFACSAEELPFDCLLCDSSLLFILPLHKPSFYACLGAPIAVIVSSNKTLSLQMKCKAFHL